MDRLHLGDEQFPLAEKLADGELVGGGAPSQDPTGEVDG